MRNYFSPSASRSAASFGAARGSFVDHKRSVPKNWHEHAGNLSHRLIAPCCVEVDAANRRQDVDAIWWHTELRDHVGLAEVRRADLRLLGWCTKPFERKHEPLCVLSIRADPNIETARRPRDAVHAQRMRSDDQELCVLRHKLAKKIAEVVDHRCSDRPSSRSVLSRIGM